MPPKMIIFGIFWTPFDPLRPNDIIMVLDDQDEIQCNKFCFQIYFQKDATLYIFTFGYNENIETSFILLFERYA